MPCPTQEALHAWLDASLSGGASGPMGEHLASCASCAGEAERVRRLARAMDRPLSSGPCPAHARLSAFAAAQLDEAARSEVLAHLGRCRACTDRVIALRRANAPIPLPRAGTRPPSRSAPAVPAGRSGILRWMAAAVLAIASLGTGVWIAVREDSRAQGQHVANPSHAESAPSPPAQETPEVAQSPSQEVFPGPPERRGVSPHHQAAEGPEPPPVPAEGQVRKPPDLQVPQRPAPAPPTEPSEASCTVSSLLGAIQVLPQGKTSWQTVKEGQSITASGHVAVRAEGARPARFTCAGCSITLDRDAEASLSPHSRGVSIALTHGHAILDGRHASSDKVTLDAAGVEIGGSGKRLAIAVDGRDAKFFSIDGEATVESGGKSVSVGRGRFTAVYEGKPPTEPTKVDIVAATRWSRAIEVFVPLPIDGFSALQPPMHLVTDSHTSYVTSRSGERRAGYIEFAFAVPRAGAYRLLVPCVSSRGEAALEVSLDGAAARELSVPAGPEWGWGAVEGMDLAPGRHLLRITDSRGGLFLSSPLLTTDTIYQPETPDEEAPVEGQGGGPGKGNPTHKPGGEHGGGHK